MAEMGIWMFAWPALVAFTRGVENGMHNSRVLSRSLVEETFKKVKKWLIAGFIGKEQSYT